MGMMAHESGHERTFFGIRKKHRDKINLRNVVHQMSCQGGEILKKTLAIKL